MQKCVFVVRMIGIYYELQKKKSCKNLHVANEGAGEKEV